MKRNEHLKLDKKEKELEAQARQWVEQHLDDGETIESLKVSIKVQTKNPHVYLRRHGGNHTYLTRQLTAEELREITSINWNPRQKKIIEYCADPSNLPCDKVSEIAQHIFSDIWDDPDETCLATIMTDDKNLAQLILIDRHHSRLSLYVEQDIEAICNRLRSRKLPYRLVHLPVEDVEPGGYRFYIKY